MIKINLGCGLEKLDGFINIDIRSEVNPDMVIDVEKGLPFKDNSIESVRAFDFLEHIHMNKTMFVIEEIYRVLKPGGMLEHFTPSTDGRGAFQDPTHRSFWNKNSWLYFMHDLYRDLYHIKAKFKGSNRDVLTDASQVVWHVHGILFAVKEE